MNNLKLHANLKWSTIIDRINKKLGYEKFMVNLGSIYEAQKDALGTDVWLHIAKTTFDKEAFINEHA